MKAVIDIPSNAEQHKAAQTMLEINKLMGEKYASNQYSFYFHIHSNSGEEEVFDLPPALMTYFEFILKNMAQGKGMEMIPLEENLSTQQAAELLCVSRPFLVKLLEEGKIPFHKVGTHRRVKLSDVQTYEKQQQAIRDQQMDFLARQAQDLNLGY